jgi:hypothetical protein
VPERPFAAPAFFPELEAHVMRKLIAIAFMLTVAAPLPAVAYTQADIDACTPDAIRLCQHTFPDKSRVVLCLVKNKRQLNAACTMAFNRTRSVIAVRENPAGVQ